jgi:hypothetical protein
MRGNTGQRTRIPRAAIIICTVIAAAACGAKALPQSRHHAATLQHPSCGSAWTFFLTGHTQLLGADHGALSCFITAARECKSASLSVTEMGVDTGTHFVFRIEPGTTPCQVTEDSRSYSANLGGSQGPVSTVSCHRTAVTSTGTMLSCRGREVLIPAKVRAPSPPPA